MSVQILRDIAQRKLVQMQRIPKVELHRHLEGALRFSTVVELCKKKGYDLPFENQRQLQEQLLVTSPMKDLKSVLDKFWMSQSILDSAEVLERITYESIEDAYNEGIRVLELRFSLSFIQKNHEYLTFDQIHRAIVDGMGRAKSSFPMAVGLISTLGRVDSPETQQSVMDFTCSHAETFLGVDLADNETGLDTKALTPLFERARKVGLRVTVHAGEQKGTHQNVVESIRLLGAERIGHGLQIFGHPEIIELVKANNVVLEICPVSNWLTNNVPSLTEHPISQLIEQGVRVTVNSDDPGIFNTSLSHDYALLEDKYGFDEERFKRLNQIAFEASFIPLAERLKVRPEFGF